MKTDRLTLASLGYLYVPVCLFLYGWIIPGIAIPLSLLIGIGVWQFGRQADPSTRSHLPFSRQEWLILMAGALFWTWVSGMGAFVPQYGDYDKHNLVFYDLITRPWPVVYRNPRFDDPFLCYYLAYYLPTAALAKLAHLSFPSAEWVSFFWGLLGVLLAFCWAARLSVRYRVWIAIGLPLLSGVEVAIRLFWSLYTDFQWHVIPWLSAVSNNRIPGYTRYEPPRIVFSNHNWAQSMDPSPLVMQLQAVPQHALGGWIAIGLVCYWQRRKTTPVALAFVVAGTLLWSPFVSIGLGLWLLFTQRNLFSFSAWLHPVFLTCCLAITGLMGSFYQAHYPIPDAGLITEAFVTPADGILYLLFWGFQLWVGFVVFRWSNRPTNGNKDWEKMAFLAAVTIQLISLVYMGRWNDFQNRSLIPAQFIYYLAMANGLANWLAAPKLSVAGWLFAGWILLGLYVPLRVVGYKLRSIPIPQPIERSMANAATNFGESDMSRMRPHEAIDADADYARQYVGKRESFFYRYFIRK
ncbi:hypothetical protein GCM10028803_23910 [Larkinella knui]|uniref:Uncharacterized protein n=1 Tax=Larkinella knui TaxID=2025310 RepID=A0A3P1CWJ6_9BACT|nr:hypothetical protein [Larkinella knui]RRB17456.1 hypothetical protein EHT87_03990 [Larkinella knui]